jgi:hypothetical protein
MKGLVDPERVEPEAIACHEDDGIAALGLDRRAEVRGSAVPYVIEGPSSA